MNMYKTLHYTSMAIIIAQVRNAIHISQSLFEFVCDETYINLKTCKVAIFHLSRIFYAGCARKWMKICLNICIRNLHKLS